MREVVTIEDITDPLAADALGLIWAARRGLSEAELVRLRKAGESSQWLLDSWSPVRSALDEWLVDRGGFLNFANESVCAAVEAAFVPDEDRRDEFRLRLAEYFEQQAISPRTCDELPWLLLQTESYQRLRRCLLDIDCFLELKARDAQELRQYWLHLGEDRTMGALYLASFEQWSAAVDRDENRICYAANELSLFLIHCGLPAEAEPLIRRALDLETKNLGSGHPFIAIWLSNLASLLESMNRLEEVEGLYRRALEISEASFGPEHPRVAQSLSNLAGFLLRTNRLDEAEKLVRRALAIDENCLGRDHPDVALRLNLLARILQRSNNLAQAEALIRRSLGILESRFGPNDSNVAASLSNLAFLLRETNQLAEAEPLLRRSLAIDEKTYGPEHAAVARDLNNLAGVLENTERLEEAALFYRRALAIFEKNLGVDHPDVGTSLNNLAQVLRKMNRLDQAEPMLLRSVQIFLRVGRATHQLDPRLPMAINNYGRLLEAMGRSTEQISHTLRETAPELFREVNSEAR